MRVRLCNGYTQTYAQIRQHTHTHKAVTGRVEAKKLLSRQRQSNYRHQLVNNTAIHPLYPKTSTRALSIYSLITFYKTPHHSGLYNQWWETCFSMEEDLCCFGLYHNDIRLSSLMKSAFKVLYTNASHLIGCKTKLIDAKHLCSTYTSIHQLVGHAQLQHFQQGDQMRPIRLGVKPIQIGW